MVAFERRSKVDRSKDRKVEAWLTLGQLVDVYKDEQVATATVANKQANKCRAHPECPQCEAARQFLCTISENKLKELELTSEKGSVRLQTG